MTCSAPMRLWGDSALEISQYIMFMKYKRIQNDKLISRDYDLYADATIL